MGRLTTYIDDQLILTRTGETSCGEICRQAVKQKIPCNECSIAEVFKKLAHYEDLEEQGYKMVNIGKVAKQLEDVAMKWESVHSQGGFIDLKKGIEIIKGGAKWVD